MPSTSGKQHRFFEWIEHTPGAAKKAGVSKSVAHDFVQADIGRHFAQGGLAQSFGTQVQDQSGFPDLDVSKYAVSAGDPSANTDNWGLRADGTPKGQGFLGLLKRPDDGRVSSEISVGVPINGQETQIPTMVPTLNQAELDYLMNHPVGPNAPPLPRSIIHKAVAHARSRIAAGLSPFANPSENLSDRMGLTPKFAGARIPDVAKLLKMAANMHKDVENVRHSALKGLSPLSHGKGYAKGGEVKEPDPDPGDKGAPVDAGTYLDNVSAVLGKGLADTAESTLNAPYAITDALARTIDNPAPLWHGLGVAGDILRHTIAHPLDALDSTREALYGLAKRTGASLSPASVGQFLRDPTAVGATAAGALSAAIPGGPEAEAARAAEPLLGLRGIKAQALTQLKRDAPEATALLAQHGTPEEISLTTPKGVHQINEMLNDQRMVSGGLDHEQLAHMALAGAAKRGWYQSSVNAIQHVFGQEDAPRFTALLAALSPRTSVESNLKNALNMWKNWNAAGRPADPALINKILGSSVEGTKGAGSVMDAWRNNSITALTHDDPINALLSGPKVESFRSNLLGNFNEVTNDAWQGKATGMGDYFEGIDRASGGVKTTGLKSPGYIATNLKTRQAADYLTQTTGHKWTPAEVQETVWSFTKSLWEKRAGAGELRPMQDIIKSGDLLDKDVASTPDFGTLLGQGQYGKILGEAGYGDRLKGLSSTLPEPVGKAVGYTPELGAIAQRLEKQYRTGAVGPALAPVRRAAEASFNALREGSNGPRPLRIGGADLVGNNLAKHTQDVFGVSPAQAKSLNALGVSTPNVAQLKPGEDSAAIFHKAISAAKKSNPYGAAVTLYNPEDYAGMKLFLTPDKKAGFALNGDDIVSVFNHPNSPHRAISPYLIQIARANGGMRLDAFNTVLPHLYSMGGMKTVSINPFNPEYAPEGWKTKLYKQFNGGQPDVHHMVWSPGDSELEPTGHGKVMTASNSNRMKMLTPDYEASQKITRDLAQKHLGPAPAPAAAAFEDEDPWGGAASTY